MYLTCEDCGVKDESVYKRFNPYLLEIEDREVEITVCDKCYDEIAADI